MQVIRAKSKSSLFLIELLIVIAFFSVASVVCVRLFARAHAVSLESRDLNRAIIVAQSAAESYKAAGGNMAHTAELFGGEYGRGYVTQHYDAEWNPVSQKQEDGYQILLQVSEGKGDLEEAVVLVRGKNGTILLLEVVRQKEAVV